MATKGLVTKPFTQEILKTFLSGLKDQALYLGFSLVDGQEIPYRNTLREYENNIWDNMTSLIKVNPDLIRPVIPRYKYENFQDNIHELKYCTNEDDYKSIRLYKLVSFPDGVLSKNKPTHLIGQQEYPDGYIWEFLQEYTIDDINTYCTKRHVFIGDDLNDIIQSKEFIIYSLEYPETESSSLCSAVSLIINPLDTTNKPLTDDFYWYSHRVNLDAQKTGSFYLKSNPSISGIIKSYDNAGYGFIMSPFDFPDTNGSLVFAEEEYPIYSFVKSSVKRSSGYVLFTQKFRTIYNTGPVKMVISLEGM